VKSSTAGAVTWGLLAFLGSSPSAQTVPPDRGEMIPILEETFEAGLNRYDGQTGLWSTALKSGRLLPNSHETVNLDPGAADAHWGEMPATLTVTPDGLSIRTVRLPEGALARVRAYMAETDQGAAAANVAYATARITTVDTWAQTYGWFEIEAQIPRGRGRWPAFWLNFAGPGWPPEIDIFEAYGEGIAAPTRKDGRFNTGVLFDALNAERQAVHEVEITNPHDKDRAPRSKKRAGRNVYTFSRHHFADDLKADIYGRVNTYAALWTPAEIIFYFGPDREHLSEIYRTPTPDDAHGPMYLLANDQFTARNNIWPADKALNAVLEPDNDFLIRSIRVWALPPEKVLDMARGQNISDPESSQIRDTPQDDIIAPGAGFDVITLSGGADELRIVRGREGKVIAGFGADDTLVLEGFPFKNRADAHRRLTQVGPDVWLSSGGDPFWPQSIILRDTEVAALRADQIVVN